MVRAWFSLLHWIAPTLLPVACDNCCAQVLHQVPEPPYIGPHHVAESWTHTQTHGRRVLNRIVDKEEEKRLIGLLQEHKQAFVRLPFELEEYAERQFRFEDFDTPDIVHSQTFRGWPVCTVERERAHMCACACVCLSVCLCLTVCVCVWRSGGSDSKTLAPWILSAARLSADGRYGVVEVGRNQLRERVLLFALSGCGLCGVLTLVTHYDTSLLLFQGF